MIYLFIILKIIHFFKNVNFFYYSHFKDSPLFPSNSHHTQNKLYSLFELFHLFEHGCLWYSYVDNYN